MLTIKQHFESIADKELREECLRLCDRPDCEVNNLRDAIWVGFFWADTPQGVKYWNDIAYKAYNNQIETI